MVPNVGCRISEQKTGVIGKGNLGERNPVTFGNIFLVKSTLIRVD